MLFFQILFSMIWIYYIYMIYFGIMYWSNVASENWEFYPRSPSRLKKQAYFSYQLLHNKKTKLRGLKQWFIICCNSLRGWLGGFSTGLTWDHSCSFIQLVVSGDSWVSLSPYALLLRYDISRRFSKRVKETEWSKFYPWKLMSSATFLLAKTSHKSNPFKE